MYFELEFRTCDPVSGTLNCSQSFFKSCRMFSFIISSVSVTLPIDADRWDCHLSAADVCALPRDPRPPSSATAVFTCIRSRLVSARLLQCDRSTIELGADGAYGGGRSVSRSSGGVASASTGIFIACLVGVALVIISLGPLSCHLKSLKRKRSCRSHPLLL